VSLATRLLGANPGVQVSSALSGALTTPGAKGAFSTISFDSIATYAVGSTAQSVITFSSIPSTYKHLQLRAFARNNSATTETAILVRLNSDSTANNYRPRHLLTGDGAAVNAYADGYGTFSGLMAGSTYGGGNPASLFAPNIIDIFDYADTTKLTTTRAINGSETNGDGYASIVSGLWLNSAAVNTITLQVYDGASFVQYSHFALYGIKG
jgi:hypothetical protein